MERDRWRECKFSKQELWRGVNFRIAEGKEGMGTKEVKVGSQTGTRKRR